MGAEGTMSEHKPETSEERFGEGVLYEFIDQGVPLTEEVLRRPRFGRPPRMSQPDPNARTDEQPPDKGAAPDANNGTEPT
jgi:hypothetical protein